MRSKTVVTVISLPFVLIRFTGTEPVFVLAPLSSKKGNRTETHTSFSRSKLSKGFTGS
jgi:hypothetical protein